MSPPPRLSPREIQILAMIACGHLNKQIAWELKKTDGEPLTTGTVKVYVNALYQKIGVTNRASAAVWFVDHYGEAPDDRSDCSKCILRSLRIYREENPNAVGEDDDEGS